MANAIAFSGPGGFCHVYPGSSLSSALKLIAVDMKLINPNFFNGRAVMVIFMLLGVLSVFWGNEDLFSAVAVSGAVSLFFALVVFFQYSPSEQIFLSGATIYFLESSSYTQWLGESYKYTKLLAISIVVLFTRCYAFWLGMKLTPERRYSPSE